MVRLSRRALNLRLVKVERTLTDPLKAVHRSLLERHLHPFHRTPGEPLTEAALLREIQSLCPELDQRINQATSLGNLELGAEKVAIAQAALVHLPVWFLGYYPRAYCTLVSCTWRVTLDEFAAARASVGRLEARLFQKNNVWSQLTVALQ